MNGNDSAMSLWHVYENLTPYEASIASLDDLCAASGVAPKAILMAIAGSGFDAGCDIANLVAAHLHPKVVDASVKYALQADGIEDRRMLLQHSGFIPVPKGQTITINASSHAVAASHAAASGSASVPSFLADMEDAVSASKVVQGEIVQTQTKELGPAPSSAAWEATLAALDKEKEKVG